MARRVNSKFLIVSSIVLLCLVATGFIVAGPLKNHFWKGDRAKKLVEAADAQVKEADAADTSAAKREKLEAAIRNYQMALGADSKNPEIFLKLGDALTKMTPFDVMVYLPASRQTWEKALEISPTYLPALHRLEDSYYRQVQMNPQAALFTRLQELAESISKIEPNDLRSHALMYIAPLNRWLASIETPAADVDTAITELSTLIDANPTAPEIADMVYFVAGAKAKRGLELKRGSQEKLGNDMLESAQKTFTEAIKANDNNADLHYRFFELLSFIRGSDFERDSTQKYRERLEYELGRARALVSKEADNYVKIMVTAAQVAAPKGDKAKAESLLLEAQTNRPTDQRVRLALAKLWRYDEVKQGEAIALLEKPIADTGWNGVEALQKMDLEVRSLEELATMYIERYGSLPEGERPEALKQIEATYDKIYARAHERSEVLKIRGKIEMLRGGQDAIVKAIQTFEKAQAQFRTENAKNQEDMDLTWLLARAYFASRQTGEAKTQLMKFKERAPDFLPVRRMLAQILIGEGDVKAAKEHVAYLKEHMPDDPDVLRLVLATLDQTKDAIEVKATYEKLPEGKDASLTPAQARQQVLAKAMVAALPPVSNPDDAVRLYKTVLAKDAGDFDALQAIREVLVTQNKKDQALELLKAGHAAKPNDDRIALVIKQLEGASPEELKRSSEALIRKQFEKDPYGLELKLYEYHLVASDRKEAFKHLEAAEKIKPDEGRVQDLMFQYYMIEQDWAKAGEYVEKLAAKSWDQAGGLIYRFRLARARGENEAAAEYARQLTTRLEQFSRSWVFLGQAQQALSQYESAISSYGVALDKQSENPEAIAGIIDCYLQLNRPNEALRYIDRGRTAHPSNAYFREKWKAYQLQFGDPAEVIKPALAERDANPNDVNRWVALGRAQYAAAKKGDARSAQYAADAKATFTEAIKKWPGEKVLWAFQSELADLTKDAAGGEALLKAMIARPEFKDSSEPIMMLADHYLRQDKPAEAEATMRQAIATFPADVDVKRRFAAYYTQNKKYAEALKLLDPASPDKLVRQQIVQIYMLSGQFADAEKLLRGLLASGDKDAQLHAMLGVVLLNENREEQAMESLGAALQIDPTNQTALYSRGTLRLKAKVPQLDGAVKDLVALRDVNPNHVDARVNLADAYRQQGHTDEAIHELTEALRLAPGRRDVRITLVGLHTSMKPPAWGEAERLVAEGERMEPKVFVWKQMQAKLYSSRGMPEKATVKIREALSVDPTNGDLLRDYFDILEAGKMWGQLLTETNRVFAADKNIAERGWWVYVKRAVALRNSGMAKESLADFVKAMEIVQADKTTNQDILIAIIEKIRTTLDIQNAIDRARMLAANAGPQANRWKVILAYLYLQNGEEERAVTAIEEARTEAETMDDRTSLVALGVAGNIYMATYKYDKGRAAYEQLIQKRPDDLSVLNNLAYILAEHTSPPDLNKALEYSQRAIDVMNKRNIGNDPNVLDTAGWINVMVGGDKLNQGIDYLNRSIQAGEIPDAYYHLGVAYLKKNIPQEAKRNLNRAVEMIQQKFDKGLDSKQPKDKSLEALKTKVDEAMAQADKALLEPRASNP